MDKIKCKNCNATVNKVNIREHNKKCPKRGAKPVYQHPGAPKNNNNNKAQIVRAPKEKAVPQSSRGSSFQINTSGKQKAPSSRFDRWIKGSIDRFIKSGEMPAIEGVNYPGGGNHKVVYNVGRVESSLTGPVGTSFYNMYIATTGVSTAPLVTQVLPVSTTILCDPQSTTTPMNVYVDTSLPLTGATGTQVLSTTASVFDKQYFTDEVVLLEALEVSWAMPTTSISGEVMAYNNTIQPLKMPAPTPSATDAASIAAAVNATKYYKQITNKVGDARIKASTDGVSSAVTSMCGTIRAVMPYSPVQINALPRLDTNIISGVTEVCLAGQVKADGTTLVNPNTQLTETAQDTIGTWVPSSLPNVYSEVLATALLNIPGSATIRVKYGYVSAGITSSNSGYDPISVSPIAEDTHGDMRPQFKIL